MTAKHQIALHSTSALLYPCILDLPNKVHLWARQQQTHLGCLQLDTRLC